MAKNVHLKDTQGNSKKPTVMRYNMDTGVLVDQRCEKTSVPTVCS